MEWFLRDLQKVFNVDAGLSLKRDPVDRDRVEDRAKRPGAIL